MSRKRILVLGKQHPVLPRVVAHYVEQRHEVLFQPDGGSIDLCVVCQQADMTQILELLPSLGVDAPSILITDAAVYTGYGEVPTSSKRGMNEIHPIVYDSRREDQLAQVLLERQFCRGKGPRVVMRLFDVYGPGILSGVIPEWIEKAQAKEPLIQDWNVQRTFLYVDDFLDALKRLENRLNDVSFDVFNVGATESIALSRLGEYVWALVNGQDSIPLVDFRVDGFDYSLLPSQVWKLPNIRRFQGFSTWQPKMSLRQGLFHTIDYLSKR